MLTFRPHIISELGGVHNYVLLNIQHIKFMLMQVHEFLRPEVPGDMCGVKGILDELVIVAMCSVHTPHNHVLLNIQFREVHFNATNLLRLNCKKTGPSVCFSLFLIVGPPFLSKYSRVQNSIENCICMV